MKRYFSLWMGLLIIAAIPVLAQSNRTAKIHGHVTSPIGSPYTIGTVFLTTETGAPTKFSFPVNAAGDYSGTVDEGTYNVMFKLPDTAPGKVVDQIKEPVKILAGQDVAADFDMTRKEFVDALPLETKKAIEEAKRKNAAANNLVNNLNADIKIVLQDFADAAVARTAASQALGASASKDDLDAKETEIRTAKFTEAESLMKRDVVLMPTEPALWLQLGQAQMGLKKYDDAEVTYKKTVELAAGSKKPKPPVQAAADAGLGEIYVRAGKVPEATAAYAEAAKLDPSKASVYLTNEAVIYSQLGNADAQAAAADEAIKADPAKALPYYLKGQALISKASVDPTTQRMVLPPGCAEAYQKYLELAPTGQFAPDVKAILDQANQKVDTSYKAPKPSKK
jgi:tetratricopeptide (TPR) repeat protein